MEFKCNGEVLEVSHDKGKTWNYVADCCDSLESTFDAISACYESSSKVTISVDEYEALKAASLQLQHLEETGVDNWEGYTRL